MQHKPTLWLRAEYKAHEARVTVTPTVAKQLVTAGYPVVIESSRQRAIDLQDYLDIGCTRADEHSWKHAPDDVIVIGLKELPVEFGPFTHRHIHFAHVYKEQHGWQAFLNAFNDGGGTLYDLEYLVHEDGRRVAAFGYWAGFVGAALAILAWVAQQKSDTLAQLTPWRDQDHLLTEVRDALSHASMRPSTMVIGALGRSGRGACDLFAFCDLHMTKWDQAETAAGGPFDEVLRHELLVNCVYLNQAVAPFTTQQHLQNADRRLAVIADVSCDPYSDINPLPIYDQCTSMLSPTLRLINNAGTATAPVDLLSIDHLPSLLPIESSNEFSDALAPHLLALDHPELGVWQRAAEVFKIKSAQAESGDTK